MATSFVKTRLAVSSVIGSWQSIGAADVRSTIRIVDSQKEKCDELRQQFHVLQERLQYLTQLKESLLTRLNQLIEAQAMSINNSGRPTPRCMENDPSHQQEDQGSSNDYRNHEPEEQDQMDYNEALASLASVINKISIQVLKMILIFILSSRTVYLTIYDSSAIFFSSFWYTIMIVNQDNLDALYL